MSHQPEPDSEPPLETDAYEPQHAALASPPPSAGGSLFDLDLPSTDDLVPRRNSDRPPPADLLASSADLDAGDLDVEISERGPELSSEGADGGDDGLDRGAEVLQVPLSAAIPSDNPERRVSLPPPERARSADEQHEQRRRRMVERVLTLRDAFRLLGHLDVREDERKAVARQLVALDTELGVAAGLSVIKDPAQALRTATKEQLDTAERLIGVLEDKLLALDDQVPQEVFRPRIEARKQSKKAIARYGRLLASRRISAGERRDRFEWIATHLLTAKNSNGELVVMPPERARAVLQHLIGGLPRKQREQEMEDALTYLNEALERLAQLRSHDELFESGWYLDVHGYKVSMREQLLTAEFLYLSVVVNARLHNRLEEWIAERERLHDSNQLTSEGTPRQQIMRRLRAQEEEVDTSFGVRRRSTLTGKDAIRSESLRPPSIRPLDSARPTKRRVSFGVEFDRSLIVLLIALLVALGSGGYLAVRMGFVGKTPVAALDSKALDRISPLLVRGIIVGSGDSRVLKGWVQRNTWKALDARRRHEAADYLAKRVSNEGIREARLMLLASDTPIIVVERGLVTTVEGGRL